MKQIKLKLKKESIKYLEEIILWYNKNYNKKYFINIEDYDDTHNVIVINDFDEDYFALYRIGNNFGRINCKQKNLLDPFLIERGEEIITINLKIISEDDKLIYDVVESYNTNYSSKFNVKKIIYDEVIFADIEANYITIQDIFFLGCSFGIKSQIKREKGEIDW